MCVGVMSGLLRRPVVVLSSKGNIWIGWLIWASV
jgi:hypothetical protein